MAHLQNHTRTYSRLSGFIFLFNLILGTGALALPKAFKDAGWLTTGILLAFFAFMSFVPATFVIEAMAIRNALKVSEEVGEDADEEEPLTTTMSIKAEDFEIDHKYELGEIVQKFAGRIWALAFYLIISIYMYGDLSVYAAAVSKSLRDVTCNSSEASLNETAPCWGTAGITRAALYRSYLIIFACSLGPFFFCNVTKTRWLQIGTTIARWVSIILMSSIAIARIIEFPEVPRLDHHQLPTYMSLLNTPVRPNPPIANFAKLPSAFGVCVYSFMCHHSLPGIITPISNKRRLFVTIMLPVYLIIFACYLLLSGTAVAAFDYIHDLYTLNFVPTSDPSLRPGWLLLLADYFLALYPVFALSSSFPVIGTTLTNNLRSLFLLLPSARRGRLVVRWGVPFLALVPPILFSMAVNDVGELVGITGAFGGSGIMYIFPGVLVFYARKALMIKVQSLTLNDESVAGDQPGVIVVNPYRSPFSHSLWLILVILWAISCLFIVILNKFSVL